MKKIKSNFDYMLDYNALIDKAEKNGYKIELNENLGNVYVYDDNDCLGSFYDELNKEKDASDYKLACKNLKSILKNKLK